MRCVQSTNLSERIAIKFRFVKHFRVIHVFSAPSFGSLTTDFEVASALGVGTLRFVDLIRPNVTRCC